MNSFHNVHYGISNNTPLERSDLDKRSNPTKYSLSNAIKDYKNNHISLR